MTDAEAVEHLKFERARSGASHSFVQVDQSYLHAISAIETLAKVRALVDRAYSLQLTESDVVGRIYGLVNP